MFNVVETSSQSLSAIPRFSLSPQRLVKFKLENLYTLKSFIHFKKLPGLVTVVLSKPGEGFSLGNKCKYGIARPPKAIYHNDNSFIQIAHLLT